MKNKQNEQSVQLTIRGVPVRVKKLLLDRADRESKSLNAILVEALTTIAGVSPSDRIYRDLDKLAGRWIEDPEFDAAIEDQDRIDESMWS